MGRHSSSSPRASWYGVALMGMGALGVMLGAEVVPKASLPPIRSKASVIQRFEDLNSLQSITSTELSPDGNFVYAAAFNSDTATVWKRNQTTGKVTLRQILTNEHMDGLLALRMSPNGNFMAGASIKDVVTLYSRDSATGELTYLSKVAALENGSGEFSFPIELRFSPDSRFVYAGCEGSLEVFRIEEDQLVGVQSETAFGDTSSIRDVDLSPDGKFVYTAGGRSLLVFSRDAQSGRVVFTGKLDAKEDNLSTLRGLNSVCCSPDNRHLYLNSGRFTDQSSVIALERNQDGSLTVIETWANPLTDFLAPEEEGIKSILPTDFAGGNEIEVSPDGQEVWALGTTSDTVVRFRRNPETGQLTLLEVHLVEGDTPEDGPAGICFSKDSRFAYVADEKEAALVVFERRAKDGN